jgi:hypothetical protein
MMKKNNNSKDLHIEFIDFMNQIDEKFADFYITKTGTEKLSTLIGKENAKFFDVIGAHSSHSLICHWQYEKGIPIERQPVVWLDSEGWPNGVFAQDLRIFISLLPYDTGFLYDIISSWMCYKENSESVLNPNEKYTKDDLKRMLDSARQRYGAYSKFLKWLDREMNIRICDDPVGLIGKAMESYPDLSKWLEKSRHC